MMQNLQLGLKFGVQIPYPEKTLFSSKLVPAFKRLKHLNWTYKLILPSKNILSISIGAFLILEGSKGRIKASELEKNVTTMLE